MSSLVQFTQQAGTHGNAFPSAHVAGATVPSIFAAKYAVRYAPLLFATLALMCVGAVYDRYHYASDVVGGLAIGVTAAAIARGGLPINAMNYGFDSIDMAVLVAIMILGLFARFGGIGRGWWPR